jgi:hypothetical protein
MRTTLEIDDDLAQLARHLAQQRHMTMGEIVSEMMRKSVETGAPVKMRNGVPLIVPRPGGRKPSLALVNQLRDEE